MTTTTPIITTLNPARIARTMGWVTSTGAWRVQENMYSSNGRDMRFGWLGSRLCATIQMTSGIEMEPLMNRMVDGEAIPTMIACLSGPGLLDDRSEDEWDDGMLHLPLDDYVNMQRLATEQNLIRSLTYASPLGIDPHGRIEVFREDGNWIVGDMRLHPQETWYGRDDEANRFLRVLFEQDPTLNLILAFEIGDLSDCETAATGWMFVTEYHPTPRPFQVVY